MTLNTQEQKTGYIIYSSVFHNWFTLPWHVDYNQIISQSGICHPWFKNGKTFTCGLNFLEKAWKPKLPVLIEVAPMSWSSPLDASLEDLPFDRGGNWCERKPIHISLDCTSSTQKGLQRLQSCFVIAPHTKLHHAVLLSGNWACIVKVDQTATNKGG